MGRRVAFTICAAVLAVMSPEWVAAGEPEVGEVAGDEGVMIEQEPQTGDGEPERPSGELLGPPKPAENSPSAIELDTTVIVGSPSGQRVFEMGRSVDVINRTSLERRLPESMPDALTSATGVHSQKTNAGAGSPIIRGMVGVDNLVLLDGVRLNNSTFRTGPVQYLALIDPWSLQRVEVVRGPGSVWYGSDAIGGVINAVSLSPGTMGERVWGGSARLAFQSATLGGGGGAQADVDSGWFRGYLGGTAQGHGELRAGGGEKQLLSDYYRLGGRLKLTQDLGGGWATTQAAFWNAIEDAGRIDSLGTGRVRTYDNEDILAYTRLDRKGSGWLKQLRLNFSYHRTKEVMTDWRCATTDAGVVVDRTGCAAALQSTLKRREEYSDTVQTFGAFAIWEGEALENRLHINAGADAYFDFVASEGREATAGSWAWANKERGNYSDGSSYTTAGAFLAADVDLLHGGYTAPLYRWNVGAGVRLAAFSASADDVPGLGSVEYSHFAPVFSANTKFIWNEFINIYADFSQGFRAANLQESTVLGNTGKSFDVPNADLEPIKANTIEVGAKMHHRNVRFSLAGFGTWLDDVIVRMPVPAEQWNQLGLSEEEVGGLPVFRRENQASGFLKGVEGGVTVGDWNGLSLWANAAWIKGDTEDADGNSTPAGRIPPLMGAGGIMWEAPQHGLFAELFVRWAGAQDRLSPEDLKDLRICEDPNNPGLLLPADKCSGTEGWYTLNARAGYAFWQTMKFNIALENITDNLYKYHVSGIYAPGFNVAASISGSY